MVEHQGYPERADRQDDEALSNGRLSFATLASALDHSGPDHGALDLGAPSGTVAGPAVDPHAVTIGIVHLGVGAFHRAHQAVVTEDAAAATGETTWGILGVTQRSTTVLDQLAPQDGLYGVLTPGPDAPSLRIVGSVRDVAFPGTDTARILAAIAAPTTHVVSLTVTEKGYRTRPDGALDVTDPDVVVDQAAFRAEIDGTSGATVHDEHGHPAEVVPARSPIGLLVRGLALRYAESGAPVTVLSCDNIVRNGHVVQRLVTQFIEAVVTDDDSTGLRTWLASCVTFPCTVVDRIVPATTDAHRAAAQALTGVRDEALVVGEPFLQWVVEDRFAGPRPAWERAGATFTDDVTPFEQAKLRMLNGTHCLLAYLGALAGHRFVADAVADPDLAAAARELLLDDVVPTLVAPPGVDLAEYAESILRRFADPSTGHTTVQVAIDGSTKLPIRLLGTVADRLAAGSVPNGAARAVAAWIVFVARGTTFAGAPLVLDDPLAPVLRAAATGPDAGPDTGPDAGLVARMLALRQVFPATLAEHAGFRATVELHVTELLGRFDT